MTLREAAEIASRHNHSHYRVCGTIFDTDNYDLALKVSSLTGIPLSENDMIEPFRFTVSTLDII